MSSKIIIAIIFAMILLVVPVFGQDFGCCCDPIAFSGSFTTRQDCETKGLDFRGPPPSVAVSCDAFCGTVGPPGPAQCGDGVCQASEDFDSCPADCPKTVVGCASPTYAPPPEKLIVKPITGQKTLKLRYELPCPADYVIISRCEGSVCTNFNEIAQVTPITVFNDEDPDLEFNKDYTYSVKAFYSISGESEPATEKGNLGDIACWGQGSSPFCISSQYYYNYQQYLQDKGYLQFTGSDFSQFDYALTQVFGTRFNQAWQCDNENKLVDTSPKVICDSTDQSFCVSDENGPRCVKQEPCGGFNPFGLTATLQICEQGLAPRYCFFGRSTTTVDKCYACKPEMQCHDYKAEGACERDNCGAGDCEWNPVYDDLGIGVCVDKRYNNCKSCDVQGTLGMDNLDAFNDIWDECTEERSNALSTALYPCFYDKDEGKSKSCDEVTCSDYTKSQCGSPSDGVKLNTDNSLKEFSIDTCNIGVCEHHRLTGCVKNADGDSGVGFQDCHPLSQDYKTCEQDYFPPSTVLIPTGISGRVDKINIRIFDKVSKTAAQEDKAGETGYVTYFCIKSASNACDDTSAFGIFTDSKQLTLKNGKLLDKKRGEIATLRVGNNKIRYYSRDAANNLEIVNELSVYACEDCNGPGLVSLEVTGGKVIENSVYTSATRPEFTFEFDEPTLITFAEITREGERIQLSQLTSGMIDKHKFSVQQPLLGEYTLNVNGHNQKNIYFDSPGLKYRLVVDPELAGLDVSPADGSVVDKTSVDIELNFTRPVILKNITLALDDFSNPHVKEETFRDITELFKTDDDQKFKAKVSDLEGGMYTIIVEAEGFNSLDIYKQSSFFMSKEDPGIRLSDPSFGVTPLSKFSVIIDTPLASECTYVYNTPTAPSKEDFALFTKMTGASYVHTEDDLRISFGEDNIPLHVYCKFDNFGVVQRTFELTLDSDPPIIVNAFAEPDVIAERFFPDEDLFVTTLKTQINKPGFCKYSQVTSKFESMEGEFPGFNKFPKESHSEDVNVTEEKEYEYYVTCIGKNELRSLPARFSFAVDLDEDLEVKSSTKQGFNQLNFTIGVSANKRVFCYYGEKEDDTTTCMGACRSAYTQWQNIKVSSAGTYKYYVKCAHATGEQSSVIEIPVIIDTTAPTMEYVIDDSSLPDDPESTWSKSKIRVAFKGDDAESGISHYLVSLQDMANKQYVFRDYVSNKTDGSPFFIRHKSDGTPFLLTNGRQYQFKVKAVNTVGLESEVKESDGVEVDIDLQPEPCFDGERSSNESDEDCGGECDGCGAGKRCRDHEDCASNYCDYRVCKETECDDEIRNGFETDVDCGGEKCEPCIDGLTCIVKTDCDSNYCDILDNFCTEAPACADGELTPGAGETDVDCGGPCDRCGKGYNCQEHEDCQEGLKCHPDANTCSSEPIGDVDKDGILDDVDDCLGTPIGEEVDEKGCGLSQTFSLEDGIDDKWRMDNFGCINCPEASAGADPDNDGLSNDQEYDLRTNPTKKDTDGDRWNDGKEVEKGTDPTNSDDHPQSIFTGVLWTIFILLAMAGLAYGGYIILQRQRKPEPVVRRPTIPKIIKPTKREELAQLRQFAKKIEAPEKDWISLEKKIKKKPLPPEKFRESLEKLRKIAHKERVKPHEPIAKLRSMLGELTKDERKAVLAKYRKLVKGELTEAQKRELFRKLKTTSEYYHKHEKEFEKELKEYGKRKH